MYILNKFFGKGEKFFIVFFLIILLFPIVMGIALPIVIPNFLEEVWNNDIMAYVLRVLTGTGILFLFVGGIFSIPVLVLTIIAIIQGKGNPKLGFEIMQEEDEYQERISHWKKEFYEGCKDILEANLKQKEKEFQKNKPTT